jgi:signal recognition particle subunit SRP54
MPGMPGMPGMGGGKKSKGKMPKQNVRKGKKGKSGNPAKRAAQESGVGVGGASLDGSAGGSPDQMTPPDLSQLPDELKKLLS